MHKFGVVLGLLVVLAGCGGDDTASNTALATVPDAAPTADPDAATSDVDAADSTDPAADVTTTDEVAAEAAATEPCELATADNVEAATGLAVVAVDDTVGPNVCVFEFGLSADVFVQTGGLAEFMFTNYTDLVEEGTAELIPDVGVAAVYSPGFRGLAVDAGQGEFFAVGLNGGYPEELADTREVLVALASAAAAGL